MATILEQFTQYRLVKIDLQNKLSEAEIVAKHNFVLHTYRYFIKPRVSILSLDQLDKIIAKPSKKTQLEVAPELFQNLKIKNLTKHDRATKSYADWKKNKKTTVKRGKDGVPIALQGIFKTEEAYLKHLVSQYKQGIYR